MLKCPLDDSPGCIVALFPVLATDGTLSYDVGRYVSIQGIGNGISHYCAEALGMPGLAGSGGIDSAGRHLTLTRSRPRSPISKAITISSVSSYTRQNPSSRMTQWMTTKPTSQLLSKKIQTTSTNLAPPSPRVPHENERGVPERA